MTKAQPTLESIERVPGSPPQLSEGDLYDIAATYADAFAGEPWNEFTRCSGDGRFYGKDTTSGQPCPDGDGGVLELAYPRKETADCIARELTRPDVSLFLLRKMGGIAGFGWGFSYASPEAFAKDKYRTPEMKQTVVSLLGRSGITGKFYYLSEVGLADDPNIRGRGLSRGLPRRVAPSGARTPAAGAFAHQLQRPDVPYLASSRHEANHGSGGRGRYQNTRLYSNRKDY
jgi:hypothetical protein